MAAPLLRRQALLLRACFQNHTARAAVPPHRPWCSSATNSPSSEAEEKVSTGTTFNLREDDPDDRRWRDIEEEIIRDIEPIVLLAKDIIHSPRYKDGQILDMEEEKAIVEKLLAYHPQSQDKIGCGLESIMVDRNPDFRNSRRLFVVRTDGAWIDFSHNSCLQNYIRYKYPIHAERFIQKHFKHKCISKWLRSNMCESKG